MTFNCVYSESYYYPVSSKQLPMSGTRRRYEHYYITVNQCDWDGISSSVKMNWSMDSMHQYRGGDGSLHIIFAWKNPKQWADSRSAINGSLPGPLRFEITPLAPGFPWFDEEFYKRAIEIMDSSSTFTKLEEPKITVSKATDIFSGEKRERDE